MLGEKGEVLGAPSVGLELWTATRSYRGLLFETT